MLERIMDADTGVYVGDLETGVSHALTGIGEVAVVTAPENAAKAVEAAARGFHVEAAVAI